MAEITEVLSLLKKTIEGLGSLEHSVNTKRIDAGIYEKKLKTALEELDKTKAEQEEIKASITTLKEEYRAKKANLEAEISKKTEEIAFKLSESERLRKQAEADASTASDLRLKYEELLFDVAAQKERILAAVK